MAVQDHRGEYLLRGKIVDIKILALVKADQMLVHGIGSTGNGQHIA